MLVLTSLRTLAAVVFPTFFSQNLVKLHYHGCKMKWFDQWWEGRYQSHKLKLPGTLVHFFSHIFIIFWYPRYSLSKFWWFPLYIVYFSWNFWRIFNIKICYHTITNFRIPFVRKRFESGNVLWQETLYGRKRFVIGKFGGRKRFV